MAEYNLKVIKKGNYSGVALEDNTHIIINSKDNTVNFLFPKEKFTEIFEKQIADKNRGFISIGFNETEIEALTTGICHLLDKVEKDDRPNTNI